MQEATDKSTSRFDATEDVLKGKELPLPNGKSFRDKDSNERTIVRIRWFQNPAEKTIKQYALPAVGGVPDEPVPQSASGNAEPNDPSSPRVFFGHYWLKADRPTRLAVFVARVDYSVAKGGSLCAYRWDGKSELDDEKFVAFASIYRNGG